jgi:hypothetical protein
MDTDIILIIMRINFKHFTIPDGIGGRSYTTGDVREGFADLIYRNANGIRAHALAMKIYHSDGILEYSDDEMKIIVCVAESLCVPGFIDGLRRQMKGGCDESNP